jgi:hypothetical protein
VASWSILHAARAPDFYLDTGRSLAVAYRSLLDFDRRGLHQTYLETLEPTPRRATWR